MFHYTTVMTNLFTLSQWDSANAVANFRGISSLVDWFSVSLASLADYVLSCGFSLMPAVYQVVGFGRGFGRHSSLRRRERSVISEG